MLNAVPVSMNREDFFSSFFLFRGNDEEMDGLTTTPVTVLTHRIQGLTFILNPQRRKEGTFCASELIEPTPPAPEEQGMPGTKPRLSPHAEGRRLPLPRSVGSPSRAPIRRRDGQMLLSRRSRRWRLRRLRLRPMRRHRSAACESKLICGARRRTAACWPGGRSAAKLGPSRGTLPVGTGLARPPRCLPGSGPAGRTAPDAAALPPRHVYRAAAATAARWYRAGPLGRTNSSRSDSRARVAGPPVRTGLDHRDHQ